MEGLLGVSGQAVLIAMLGLVPRQILYFYAMMRLLDVPRPRLAFLACSAFGLVAIVAATPLPIPARFAVTVALCSLPVFAARDRATHKVFIAVSVVLIAVAADLADGMMWYAVTGSAPTREDVASDMVLYTAVSAVHLLFLDVLLIGFRHFANKYLRPEVKCYSGEGPKYFVLFPLLQLPLLGTVALCAFDVGAQWDSGFAALLFALSLICLGSDLFLFYTVEQFVLERIEASRVGMLKQRLEDDLGRYRELALVLENSAQLRHDLRNQTQVVRALAERGDFARARGCVAELLEEIGRIDASEKAVLPAESPAPAPEPAAPADSSTPATSPVPAAAREEGAR